MSALARRFPSPCRIPSHFTRIPYRHIRSHLYRSKIVYKSKGHRFESCPVHHKPPALRSVGGFSFCLVMLGNFPLRDLCGMGHGAGFLLCFHFFFFRSSGQFLQIVSHRPENAADQVPRRNNTMTDAVPHGLHGRHLVPARHHLPASASVHGRRRDISQSVEHIYTMNV